MTKKIFALLAAAAVLTPAAYPVFTASAAQAAPVGVTGDLVKVTTAADFRKGTLANCAVTADVGDGAVKLAAGATEGEFTSAEYAVPAFTGVIVSWNSDTPEGTTVEVLVRAFADAQGAWSDWHSLGVWSPFIARASVADPGTDPLAQMDTDMLSMKDGNTANRLQFRAVLRSDAAGKTPVLRLVAGTYQNENDTPAVKAAYAEKRVPLKKSVTLATPAYSQMIRDKPIRNSICSPTTIATLLNDRGCDLFPEEVALNCYDFGGKLFGNWAFCVAAAGSYGYESYAQFGDLDVLREELSRGYSVGLSVKYTNDPANTDLPFIAGAPITTSGHLITVRGYETVDDIDYFDVSDSAAPSDASALRRYRADELDAAWVNRVCYIVHGKEKNAGGCATRRVPAELRETGGGIGYDLYVDGKRVDLPGALDSDPLFPSGGGAVLCVYGDAAAPASRPTATTSANKKVGYDASVTADGGLLFDESAVPAKGARACTVYIVMNDGKVYVASVTLMNAATAAMAAAQTRRSTALARAGAGALLLAVAGTGLFFFLRKRKRPKA